MTRRLSVSLLALAAAAATLTACSGPSNSASPNSGSATATAPDSGPASSPAGQVAPITVVASTDVWGDIAKTVGGDHVAVTSIITSPDQDPHEFEANAQNQLSLSKAQVVIENGGGYDDFMDTMLHSAKNTSATVLDAVDISGKKAPAGGDLNEHVWYDFPTVDKVIDQIAGAYSKADSADASSFTSNASALKTKIETLTAKETTLKAKYQGKGVAITEPVPLYMLQAIGLDNKTPAEFSEAVEEDHDVSAAVLQQTLKLFSGHQVALLAYNAQTTGTETEAVLKAAKDADIPVVPVTETLPSGKDYVGWMSDNLTAIGNALGQ